MGVQKRFILTLMAFFGFFHIYALRVNLSVAIVHMQSQYNWGSALKGRCVADIGSWPSSPAGNVLGAFFFGYIVTQIPGGWLATR
jgi:ACS family sodium-dependent inorganic phosphate cotransporter